MSKRNSNNELMDMISKMPLATLISFCDIFDRYLYIRIKQYRNWVKVNALIYLINRGESCAPSTLATLMLRSRTGITDLLNNLENANLIRRMHSNKDRRSITIKVTSKGIKYVFDRINKLPQIEEKIQTYLSDEELSTLVNITRKLKFAMIEDITGSEYPRPKDNKS